MNNNFLPKNLNCNKNAWMKKTDNLSSSYEEYERSTEKLAPYDNSSWKLFELSNSKVWSKYSKNSVNANSRNNKKMNEPSSTIYNSLKDLNIYEERPKSLKIREFDLEKPKNMMAEINNIEMTKNRAFLETVPLDDTQSSVSSSTEGIENLDMEIKKWEMREPKRSSFLTKALIENAEKISPILDETKYHSINYTPRKNFISQLENNDEDENVNSHENFLRRVSQNYESFVNEINLSNDESIDLTEDLTDEEKSRTSLNELENFCQAESFREEEISMNRNESTDDANFSQETSKIARKIPIMESTRKLPHSNSTKIKYPTPNRVNPNSISTIAISEVEEDDSRSKNHDHTLDNAFCTSLPYEVEHFLEDALGDEILDCTNVTYATCDLNKDRNNSHYTASELISHDASPLHQRIVQLLQPPMLKPIHKYSSTLDRSLEVYRSISRKIKKKFGSGVRAEETPAPVIPNLPSGAQEKEKICQLLQEVNVQQSLINQATKALNLCNSMKEFIDSLERIESERLLLLATLRKKSIVEEIRRITGPEENKNEKNWSGQRGRITISEMKLNLQVSINREEETEEMVDWFVLVVSQGLQIWATQPMSYKRITDSKICFPDEISIPELRSNFKILLEVYTMKVRKTSFNHEDKYHIRNEEKKNTSCIPCLNISVSPTRFFKKIERPCHGQDASRNHTTAFVLSGFVQLFLHDLTLPSPWPLLLVPENSILHGTIDLNLACRLHLSINHEGFITDGDEAGGFLVWNRRWCVLKGRTLMFWNYPDDQETKKPVKIIDLINCSSSKITTVDRTICAKSRTLIFETSRPKMMNDKDSLIVECPGSRTSGRPIRHLMSLDSVHELREWSSKLNQVLMALGEWNVIS